MKALIIVDFQKDFVDGSLGFPSASSIEKNIISIIDNYDDIIFTYDTHHSDYPQTLEGKFIPPLHCIEGTDGWQVYGEVAKYVSKAKAIFKKNSFGSLELGNWLKDQPYDEIDLCGLVSHMCLFSNAVIARNALPNATIRVLRDCSASFDRVLEERSYDELKALLIEVK